LPKTSPVPVPVHEILPEADLREQALGASGAAIETTPKRTRRMFSAAEKLRIVKKADACIASGERGALEAMLREEGLYSSALSSWRRQLGKQGAAGLELRKMGRKPKLDAKDRLNAQLLKRTAVLERKLHIAEAIIALQKKAHEILGIALPVLDDET
jgi:transposase